MILAATTLCIMAFPPITNFKAPLSVWACKDIGFVPSRNADYRNLKSDIWYPFDVVIDGNGNKILILKLKADESDPQFSDPQPASNNEGGES